MKKKGLMIIIGIFILAIVGFGGYKVYSYYTTEGDFNTNSVGDDPNNGAIILDKVFSPRVSHDGDITDLEGDFLNGSFSMTLTCGTAGADGYATCVGQTNVINKGTDPLDVLIEDARYSFNDSFYESTEIADSSFNWVSTTIPAGEHRLLTLTVNVQVVSDYILENEESVSAPVTDEYSTVYVGFSMTASNHVG